MESAFLADGTGRVLENAAEFTITRLDEPEQREFRATFLDFVLSRSPSFLLASVDEPLVEDLEFAVRETLRDLSASREAREALLDWIEHGIASSEGQTVGALLEIDEGSPVPPTDALADASWPLFLSLVENDFVSRWLDGLVDELVDFVGDRE